MTDYGDERAIEEGIEAMKHRERIEKRSKTFKAKQKSFMCRFCSATTIIRAGKESKINSIRSLSQHEIWCKENPLARKYKKKESPFVPIIKNQIFTYKDLEEIITLSEKLNLSAAQILNLIKLKIGDI